MRVRANEQTLLEDASSIESTVVSQAVGGFSRSTYSYCQGLVEDRGIFLITWRLVAPLGEHETDSFQGFSGLSGCPFLRGKNQSSISMVLRV